MASKETYYVYRNDNGVTGRVAKFADNLPYGYDKEKKEWIFMPSLMSIREDVTSDFVKISKEEAERLINA